MYVTGRQPQKSHVAYHEVEQLKNSNNKEKEKDRQAGAASTVREVTVQKRKRPVKKAYSTNQVVASSTKVTTTAKFTPNPSATASTLALVNGKFRQPRKLRRTQNYSGADAIVEETQNKPVRVKVAAPSSRKNVAEPEVAASDTEYTQELGVKLPKYLLEKTDFEKSFYPRH